MVFVSSITINVRLITRFASGDVEESVPALPASWPDVPYSRGSKIKTLCQDVGELRSRTCLFSKSKSANRKERLSEVKLKEDAAQTPNITRLVPAQICTNVYVTFLDR